MCHCICITAYESVCVCNGTIMHDSNLYSILMHTCYSIDTVMEYYKGRPDLLPSSAKVIKSGEYYRISYDID